MGIDVKGRGFVVGEKPRPTPFFFRLPDGTLDTQWNGWTFTAYVQNNSEAESSFACTNNGDGTGSIDWPTAASKFIAAGVVRVKLRAINGAYEERVATITFKVRSE